MHACMHTYIHFTFTHTHKLHTIYKFHDGNNLGTSKAVQHDLMPGWPPSRAGEIHSDDRGGKIQTKP